MSLEKYYGVVKYNQDQMYCLRIQPAADGTLAATLINGKTVSINEADIVRHPKPIDTVGQIRRDQTKEIVPHKDAQLPTTIDALHTYVLVGEQRLKAHKAKIAAIRKVPDAHAAEEAALADAQGLAEVVIAAKAKLGELLAALPKPKFDKKLNGSSRGTTGTLPPGITKKESHESQLIAKHPDLVQQVIAKAITEQRIPTPYEVTNRIRCQREKEWKKKADAHRKEIKAVIAIDQALHISSLDKCICALPQKPPEKWNEDAFKEAKSKSEILTRRLSSFQTPEPKSPGQEVTDSKSSLSIDQISNFLDRVITEASSFDCVRKLFEPNTILLVRLKGAKRKSRGEDDPPRTLAESEEKIWRSYFKSRRAGHLCDLIAEHFKVDLPAEVDNDVKRTGAGRTGTGKRR